MSKARLFRLGWQLLLATLLLLMQQGALRHGLQHIKGEDSTPSHQLCKDCLSFHAAAEALHSSSTAFALNTELQEARAEALPAQPCFSSVQHYFARAPPSATV